ncbi:uncharacterized protein LOC112128007 [Cimex lectularius]|uniref:Uncharacterized protein n=1 Tax=Cimex lectularius TaxID=79782 RepID=A0A8I6STT9_CIMLE|nr:uncharacterized protein LOC112128007 [Cimex lectularius]
MKKIETNTLTQGSILRSDFTKFYAPFIGQLIEQIYKSEGLGKHKFVLGANTKALAECNYYLFWEAVKNSVKILREDLKKKEITVTVESSVITDLENVYLIIIFSPPATCETTSMKSTLSKKSVKKRPTKTSSITNKTKIEKSQQTKVK